jgi:hypothetical protein
MSISNIFYPNNWIIYAKNFISSGTLTGTNAILTNTSNQITLGTTNTTTLNASAPSASRVYTIPDALTNTSFLMTDGAQSINDIKSFNSAPDMRNAVKYTENSAPVGASGFTYVYADSGTHKLSAKQANNTAQTVCLNGQDNTFSVGQTITPVTNQIVLGTTNTTTINSSAPSASRVYTIPDAGSNSSFVLDHMGNSTTQLSSISTNVTLNARAGYITMQGVVPTGAATVFNLINNFINSNSNVILAMITNTQSTVDFFTPIIIIDQINNPTPGQCRISITNNSSHSTGSAPIIQFLVI